MSLMQVMTGCWAIDEPHLREIHAIYATHLRGEKIDIAAVEARIGHPLASEQSDTQMLAGGVALIEASGVLAPKANLFMQISGGISTRMLTQQVEQAAAAPSVKSILLSMDSPGGNVLGVPEAAEAVFQASKIKPVVVHVTEGLQSAGYYIGAAANAIYVSGPVVQVGSIGVLMSRNYDPTKTQVEENITAGKYKRLGNDREALSPEARAVYQADVDYLYSIFVDDVARFRGTTSDNVLEFMAEGRQFRGQQAIDAGLVDGVSTRDALIQMMASNPDQFAERRRARFKVATVRTPTTTTGAGAAQGDVTANATTTEGNDMEPITREMLEKDHAPTFKALQNEFMAAGAKAERDRIEGVRATSVPGHEALVEQMANDGTTQPGDAALRVVAAVRAATAAQMQAHTADAPQPVAASAAPAVEKAKDPHAQVVQAKAYQKEHGCDFVTAMKSLGFSQ